MPTQSESAITVTLIYGGVHVIVVNVIFFALAAEDYSSYLCINSNALRILTETLLLSCSSSHPSQSVTGSPCPFSSTTRPSPLAVCPSASIVASLK